MNLCNTCISPSVINMEFKINFGGMGGTYYVGDTTRNIHANFLLRCKLNVYKWHLSGKYLANLGINSFCQEIFVPVCVFVKVSTDTLQNI